MKSITRLVCVLAVALGFAASFAHAQQLFVADFNDLGSLNIYDGGSLENGWSLLPNGGGTLTLAYASGGQPGGPDIFSPTFSSGSFVAAVTIDGSGEDYQVTGILAQIPGQAIPISLGSDPGWGGNVWINFNHASTFITVPKNTQVTLTLVGTASAAGDTITGYYNTGAGYVLVGSVNYNLGAGGSVQIALNTGMYGNAPYPNSSATVSDFSVTWDLSPVITSLVATPDLIWPPNKQMVPITLQAEATDPVGITSLKIISVSSNEPDPKTTEWQITGDLTLNLLADRNGKGSGRIYTITVQATDSAGNTSTKTVTVTVPHDQG